jgi:spermidine synthase
MFFNSCIFKTVSAVYKSRFVIPGAKIILIASNSTELLDINPDTIIQRLKERGIHNKYFTEYYIPFKLDPERVVFALNAMTGAEKTKLNTDLQPVCYYYNFLLWREQFTSSAEVVVEILIAVAGIFYLLRFLWRRRALFGKQPILVFVFTFGFAGISIELILIILFQAIYGYIFSFLGILFALFMAGLAFGSLVISAITRRRPAKFAIRASILTGLSLAIFSGLLPIILLCISSTHVRTAAIKTIFACSIAIIGAIVGAVYPAALGIQRQNSRSAAGYAGRLYAADLWGACSGGIITSMIFIPLLGVTNTCILLCIVTILSTALILPTLKNL